MSSLLLDASRFSIENKNLLVLELKSDGFSKSHYLSRKEVLYLGKQKCIEVFGKSINEIRTGDIHVLIPEFVASEPIIVSRMLACLINLNQVRCLILWDRMVIFTTTRQDEVALTIQVKLNELIQGISDSNLAFESNGELSDWIYDRNEFIEEIEDDEDDSVEEEEEEGRNENGNDDDNEDDDEGAIELIKQVDELFPEEPESIVNDYGDVTKANPFELNAFEAALWTALKVLERDYQKLRPLAMKATKKVRNTKDESSLETLRHTRANANRLLSQAVRQVKALEAVLESDEDMALMCFANVLKHPDLYRDDQQVEKWKGHHEDMEILFETYIQRFDSIIHNIRFVIEEMELTENDIATTLDVGRNRLIRLNFAVASLVAFSNVGAFVTGLFGMNLNSELDFIEQPPLFWIVCAIVLGIFFIGLIVSICIAVRI